MFEWLTVICSRSLLGQISKDLRNACNVEQIDGSRWITKEPVVGILDLLTTARSVDPDVEEKIVRSCLDIVRSKFRSKFQFVFPCLIHISISRNVMSFNSCVTSLESKWHDSKLNLKGTFHWWIELVILENLNSSIVTVHSSFRLMYISFRQRASALVYTAINCTCEKDSLSH